MTPIPTTPRAAAADAWREPFERALDADPSDQRVRRDLADHLDERGDPDAEAVRWLADNGKWPTPPGDESHRRLPGAWDAAWNWWSDNPPDGPELGGQGHAHVPYGRPSFLYQRLNWNASYPTRREAEADFCRAYHAARAAGWEPGVT